jgi:tetratricopeptide (TPR) repeat protein
MARAYLEEALSLHYRLENLSGAADVLHNLASLAEANKQYETALECLAKSLELSEQLGDLSRVPQALMLLAIVALGKGELVGAIRVFAAAERAFDQLGIAPVQSEVDNCRSRMRNADHHLSDSVVQQERLAWAELSPTDAVRTVISEARRWSTF